MEELENRELSNKYEFGMEIRPNGTEVFTEPYNEKRVRRLKKIILNFYTQGEEKYYAIYVDGEKVVEKTADGRKFNRYLNFVDEDTKIVEVRLYHGDSFNCNRYLFMTNNGLSGVPKQPENIQGEINKALKAQERHNELIYLRAELEKKDRKYKKLKKILAEKEGAISMGSVKEFLVEGKSLVDAFRGKASADQLGGAPPQQDSEVTIEAEPSEEQSEGQIIYNQLYEKVGAKGIKKALKIMGVISHHPEIETIVINELKKKEEEENGEA